MKHKFPAAVLTLSILISTLFFTACMTPEQADPEKGPPETGKEPVERPGDKPGDKPREDAYNNIEELINKGDSESAVREFEKVKDDSSETVIAYAGLLMASGDYGKAETELLSLLEREPMNADAYFNLALIKGLKGEPEAEVEMLDKAIAVDDAHSPALSVRGVIYLSESKIKKASEMFKRSLDSDADNIIALTGYGSALIREDKYEEAEGYLDRAVELDPANPFTYLDRSGVRAANGDMEGAESDMSAAIELEPDYFWHYLDRGRLRIRDLGDRKGALEDFNRAIELDPAIFYPYVFRAGIYDDMDEYELAAADYKLVIEAKPDYYFAYSSLGIMQFMISDWEGCRSSFEKAFKLEPEEYAYLAMAAVAVTKMGDKLAARKYYSEIMDKIPTASIYYHILRSYLERGYDAYALRKIQDEENEGLQKRLLFYIAELYHQNGMETAAYSYFTLVKDAENLGYFESRIAEHELESHYE